MSLIFLLAGLCLTTLLIFRFLLWKSKKTISVAPQQALSCRRANWRMISAGILLSASLLGILFTQIDLTSLGSVWKGYRPEFFMSALLMFFLSQVFRALRFRPLIGGRNFRTYDLLPLLCIQSLAQKFAPFMGGEISFLYLLRNKMGVGYSEGAIVLVLARGIDLFIAGMCLVIMAFLPFWRENPSIQWAGLASGAVGMLLVALALVAVLNAEKFSQLSEKSQHQFSGLLVRMFIRFFAGVNNVRVSWRSAGFWGPLAQCTFWSVFMWIALFLVLYFLFSGASDHVSWELVLWGFFATWILAALPIRGFADIGVWEGGWTVIFVGDKMPAAEALRIAIAGHAGLIAITTLVGGIPLLLGFARTLRPIGWPSSVKGGPPAEKV